MQTHPRISPGLQIQTLTTENHLTNRYKQLTQNIICRTDTNNHYIIPSGLQIQTITKEYHLTNRYKFRQSPHTIISLADTTICIIDTDNHHRLSST